MDLFLKINAISEFPKEIMKRENWSGDSEKSQKPLSADDYDKKKSSLKLSISATNEKGELRWRGYRDTKMKMVQHAHSNLILSRFRE